MITFDCVRETRNTANRDHKQVTGTNTGYIYYDIKVQRNIIFTCTLIN